MAQLLLDAKKETCRAERIATRLEKVRISVDGVRRFDITARLDDRSKASVQSIERIPLKTSSGAIVPLAAVADVNVAEGYSFIRRPQTQL